MWPVLTTAASELLAAEYPRFSNAEYERRRSLLLDAMEERGLDHLLVVTDLRSGNAPQWLTGWPGTVEAYLVLARDEPMTMSVEWFNHTPLASRLAAGVQVVWGEHRGIGKVIEDLSARGARRVGLIGPLIPSKFRLLDAAFDVTLMDAVYTRCRMVKSEEELEWLRLGAALTDAGFAALVEATEPGMDERELGAVVAGAYLPYGATTMLHYIGVTAMDDPRLFVPPQFHAARRVASRDVVFCELSASWWDYAGQILRTFIVDAEPTTLFQSLHDVAEEAFDAVESVLRPGVTMAEIRDASSVIERRGYSTCDDLLHGFGGGYLPPVVASVSRPSGPLPDMVLQENMVVVLQPNVISREVQAGVQVGEMLRITQGGVERLHRVPRGLLRAKDRISPDR